jgi:hypothetical protein
MLVALLVMLASGGDPIKTASPVAPITASARIESHSSEIPSVALPAIVIGAFIVTGLIASAIARCMDISPSEKKPESVQRTVPILEES